MRANVARLWRRLGSAADLQCNLLSARRGTDLDEEPVRLAQCVVPAGFVAGQTGELRIFEVKEGLIAFRARPLDPSRGLVLGGPSSGKTTLATIPARGRGRDTGP